MAGIPNRKKAISLVAISTPGDLKTYPTGTYCVPADGDGTFLLSDSTVPAQFSWSSGSNGAISYDKTTGATNVSVLTASNIYVSNNLTVEDYLQLLPVNDTPIPTNQTASYIYTSGSTNDLYFTQYDPASSYNNTTRLRWLESAIETGLLHGGRLTTVNGTTTFSIASGSGIVVTPNASLTSDPYPTIKYVQWSNFVSQSLPSITTTQITYIAIDSSGSIVRSSSPFTDGDYANYIVLGRILHQTGSVTNGAITAPVVAYGSVQNKVDFFRAFGPLKLSGHTLAASGSSLGLTKTAGNSFAIGRNYTVDPNMPNYVSATTDTALTGSKIYREYVSGSTLVLDTGIGNAGYTDIDPTKRLVASTGLLTSVPSGKYTLQRVFWFPNSVNKALHVYYGNTQYNSLDEAQAGINSEDFVEDRYTSTEAIFVAYICVKSNATNLSDTAEARIIQAGFARGVGGGAGGSSPGATGPAGGDLTGTYPDPTLTTITTAGTSGSATVVPIVTIDAKGRVTSLSSSAIAITTASVSGLGTAAGLASDTDGTLAANSDTRIATQKATKTYADTKLALTGGALTGDLTINSDKSLKMTEGSFYNLTRAMPTASGNTIEIGNITNTDFAANCELWYNSHSNGFAQSKRYFFPLSYNATNNVWQKLLPISSTGIYAGEDTDIEINVYLGNAYLRARRSSFTLYPNGTMDLVLFINGSNTTFTATTGSATGVTAPTAIYPVKAEGFLSDYLGAGVSSVPATNRSLIMANTMVTDAGSYTLNSWNGTGVKVPVYSSAPSNNGGATPAVSQPALVLARQGVGGVAYGNFAELKVRRWEAAGVAARTGLDIALTHGNGDAAGTNIMSLTSNGNVGIGTLTPSASLHLRAGTTTAGSAPLKFTSGSVMTTPEAGAMEYNGSNLYFTTGSVRENIILTSNLATKVSKTGDTMTGNLVVSGAKIGINNGATAIAATDLHIGSGSIAIDGAVSTRLEPIISSPGNYARTLTFHPTYTGNTGVNAIALQTLPEVGSGASMPLLYGMLSAFIGNVTTWVGIAVVDGGGTATTKYDAIFNGGGRVGIATSTPTARLQIGAGSATANTAPLKFTSGTNLTSVESGSMEYDGTHLYFSPVATRKIVTYRKNVTAVSSSLTASVDSCLIASGSFTITLPNPSTVGNGAEITIKKTSTGASTITISASAGFVEGATTTTLTTQYSTYRFISDGSTNWWSI